MNDVMVRDVLPETNEKFKQLKKATGLSVNWMRLQAWEEYLNQPAIKKLLK